MVDVVTMTGALDPRSSWEATHCSLAKALDVVSTRTALLLMREAFYGTTRYEDFVERAGASQAIVAARLRELVDSGLLVKEPYREAGQRTRHGYRLTEKGRELFPVLVAFMQWGDRWENDGGRVQLHHTGCGARVRTELRCSDGHVVGPGDTELRRRPGRTAGAGSTKT